MDVQNLSQYQTPETPAPLAPSTPPSHRWGMLAAFFALAVAVSAGAYFFLSEKYETSTVIPSYTPRASVDPMADWETFSSQYFTLSFKIPDGFEVKEDQNHIYISKGPFISYEIGSTNAFFTIQRFVGTFTQEQAISTTRKELKNISESTVVVDGTSFLKIEGEDAGRYEGVSAGKIVRIFFEKSMLEIGGGREDFDALSIGNQILSTFKFSKSVDTSTWKIYTNTQYGFEFKYPADWKLGATNNTPSILINSGKTSTTACEGLGCPPRPGDRQVFTKGDTTEGAPPLSPWYKMLYVKGDAWVQVQVTAYDKICTSQKDCQDYLSKIPSAPQEIAASGYQTYNQFVDLLSTFRFAK